MAVSSSSGTTRELDQTPTWAVAGVCLVIIIISIALEKVLHKVGMWFTKRHKKALFQALEKVKAELMVLGFISLLLTFSQYYIAQICIPYKIANTMLPCPAREKIGTEGRRLLWFEHRVLAAGGYGTACKAGKVPLISVNGLHQLHILIFFLAVFHVIYSAVTMALGKLKIRGWKQWEQETSSQDYRFSADNSRFRLAHETTFVRAHTSFWTRNPVFFYIVHLAPGSKFNFQKYIKRSLEDDYKTIVAVSPVLWASFVTFLLLNVYAVGAKLQAILTRMALEITDRVAVVQGIPLVQGSDKYFWLGRPQLVLNLIHFALFQNAFQITYFLWIWYSFGLKSCFHYNFKIVIAKIAVGFGVLFLCSYITLPLYALVAQMGSHMKKSIFDQQTAKALKKWHKAAKKRGGKSPTHPTLGGSPPAPLSTQLPSSAGATLPRFKTTSHSTCSYEDHELSDFEADTSSPTNLFVRIDHDSTETETSARPHPDEENRNESDFSFSKSAAPLN
ncbi:hypothetical protein Vadar_031952 [Vaccinium darrowii]|uniref:Uncharacterized protein n=1 Tax=Vaccinium darrowii TaxID=229202 RepID=A0ACB7YIJ1_9ERIC|nr:hypothetical protein Vadar_031952 [Vaccinium darrowii]